MMARFFSLVLLIDGILIGLGAFGHGSAVRHVHAALDQFPVIPDVATMIYVVWFFVSGCMVLFGLTVVWVWFRLRAGDRGPLLVAYLIGALYLAVGIGGMIYRHGDPFMAVFIVLGGLLLLSSYVLRRGLQP